MKTIRILALTLIFVLLAGALVSCNEAVNAPTPTNTPTPTEDPQKLARGDARGALSTFLANTSSEQTGVIVEEGTVFVVEKFGKWYSFVFIEGQITDGEIFETAPDAPQGFVLETDEVKLNLIPEYVSIYIPIPQS